MNRNLTIGSGILLVAGFLLSNTALASQEHYHHEDTQAGEYYSYDNACQGGLKVFAHLDNEYYVDGNTPLKISFSANGYVKSKTVYAYEQDIGYLFYQGVVPEYGSFKVTLRNQDTGAYEVVTGYNDVGCHPEYVTIEVPQ